MEQLKKQLNDQSTLKRYSKLSDLEEHTPYKIISMKNTSTRNGVVVVGCLFNNMNVFIPRLKLTNEEIEAYNINNDDNKLHLLYRGKSGNAYLFDFQ